MADVDEEDALSAGVLNVQRFIAEQNALRMRRRPNSAVPRPARALAVAVPAEPPPLQDLDVALQEQAALQPMGVNEVEAILGEIGGLAAAIKIEIQRNEVEQEEEARVPAIGAEEQIPAAHEVVDVEEVDEIDVGNAAPPVDIVDVDDDEVVVVGEPVNYAIGGPNIRELEDDDAWPQEGQVINVVADPIIEEEDWGMFAPIEHAEQEVPEHIWDIALNEQNAVAEEEPAEDFVVRLEEARQLARRNFAQRMEEVAEEQQREEQARRIQQDLERRQENMAVGIQALLRHLDEAAALIAPRGRNNNNNNNANNNNEDPNPLAVPQPALAAAPLLPMPQLQQQQQPQPEPRHPPPQPRHEFYIEAAEAIQRFQQNRLPPRPEPAVNQVNRPEYPAFFHHYPFGGQQPNQPPPQQHQQQQPPALPPPLDQRYLPPQNPQFMQNAHLINPLARYAENPLMQQIMGLQQMPAPAREVIRMHGGPPPPPQQPPPMPPPGFHRFHFPQGNAQPHRPWNMPPPPQAPPQQQQQQQLGGAPAPVPRPLPRNMLNVNVAPMAFLGGAGFMEAARPPPAIPRRGPQVMPQIFMPFDLGGFAQDGVEDVSDDEDDGQNPNDAFVQAVEEVFPDVRRSWIKRQRARGRTIDQVVEFVLANENNVPRKRNRVATPPPTPPPAARAASPREPVESEDSLITIETITEKRREVALEKQLWRLAAGDDIFIAEARHVDSDKPCCSQYLPPVFPSKPFVSSPQQLNNKTGKAFVKYLGNRFKNVRQKTIDRVVVANPQDPVRMLALLYLIEEGHTDTLLTKEYLHLGPKDDKGLMQKARPHNRGGSVPLELRECVDYFEWVLGQDHVKFLAEPQNTCECSVCFDDVPVDFSIFCEPNPDQEAEEETKEDQNKESKPLMDTDEEPPYHVVCLECLRRAVILDTTLAAKGGRGIRCVMRTCHKILNYETFRTYLPSKSRQYVENILQTENLRAAGLEDELEQCIKCNYRMIIEAPKEQDHVFTCPHCRTKHCRQCKRNWMFHIGKRCEELAGNEEDMRRTFLENQLTMAVIRTCPQCKVAFEKEEGCNKMTCRCGLTMCYLCRETDINYTHFCQHPRTPGRTRCSNPACKSKCLLWTDHRAFDQQRVAEVKDHAVRDNILEADDVAKY